jgi:hypothetical protein
VRSRIVERNHQYIAFSVMEQCLCTFCLRSCMLRDKKIVHVSVGEARPGHCSCVVVIRCRESLTLGGAYMSQLSTVRMSSNFLERLDVGWRRIVIYKMHA